jgi:hypothetical protein
MWVCRGETIAKEWMLHGPVPVSRISHSIGTVMDMPWCVRVKKHDSVAQAQNAAVRRAGAWSNASLVHVPGLITLKEHKVHMKDCIMDKCSVHLPYLSPMVGLFTIRHLALVLCLGYVVLGFFMMSWSIACVPCVVISLFVAGFESRQTMGVWTASKLRSEMMWKNVATDLLQAKVEEEEEMMALMHALHLLETWDDSVHGHYSLMFGTC